MKCIQLKGLRALNYVGLKTVNMQAGVDAGMAQVSPFAQFDRSLSRCLSVTPAVSRCPSMFWADFRSRFGAG